MRLDEKQASKLVNEFTDERHARGAWDQKRLLTRKTVRERSFSLGALMNGQRQVARWRLQELSQETLPMPGTLLFRRGLQPHNDYY